MSRLFFFGFELITNPFPEVDERYFFSMLVIEGRFSRFSLNPEFYFTSISLAPTNSFFQLLNFCTMLIFILILKMIFYKKSHKNRFYLFLSIIGFLAAFIGAFFYLSGITNMLTFENSF